MAIPLKDHKVAGALPTTPQPNARYYVKNGNNVVEYVTDSSGNPFNLNGIPAQRVVFQLNGGYNINTSSAGTPITIGSILNGNIPNVTTSGSTVTLPDGVFDVTYTVSVNTTVQRSNQNFRLDVSGGQSYGKFGPLYIRSSSGHNSAGTDLKFPVTITGGGGACELFSIRESASGTTNIVGTSNLGGIEVPVSYLTIERKA